MARQACYRFSTTRYAQQLFAVCALWGAALTAAHAKDGGPLLMVDVVADRHPISPDIYGMNVFGADAGFQAFMAECRLPVNRQGGDATTRYNWKIDASNAGDDWFFMAGNGDATHTPSGSTDKFIAANRAASAKSLLTIPIIDYINKAASWDCTYPVSRFGKQEKVNPYVHPMIDGKPTDAGNGRKAGGR